MTVYAPVKITRGEDVTLNGTVTDQDGAVVDISAGSLVFNVKDNKSAADAAIVLSVAGTSLTSGGLFNVVINDTDTKSLTVKSYVYDIEYTNSSGQKSTLSSGKFILFSEVTKA